MGDKRKMKRDCSTCICKEGSCYPSTTIFDKDKTCKSYDPDYEGYIEELEKENIELKTKKIPQLERRIASIRGSHRVDVKKLNARIEQVERLKKENAELNNFIMQSKKDGISPINALIIKNLGNQLIEAKEIIKGLLSFVDSLGNYSGGIFAKAEQFLSEVEK